MIRKAPPTASIATPGSDARMHAPAAERNLAVIADLVAQAAPLPGAALELASGTGQHAAHLARSHPDLHWQPTEPDAARRASIDAWIAETGASNASPARALDACAPGWSRDFSGQSLILLVNLLHLISLPETRTLIHEAAQALAPTGAFVIYGPFMRNGRPISDGDARFHASLRADDPEIGYKSDHDIIAILQASGLARVSTLELPANNLGLIARP
ncbi:MAG: class I SAM-dependent methyltransferase [Marinibacterium sp.]|nr:class I SAM-dependent methyltransferase [Marinibacterium sp.]